MVDYDGVSVRALVCSFGRWCDIHRGCVYLCVCLRAEPCETTVEIPFQWSFCYCLSLRGFCIKLFWLGWSPCGFHLLPIARIEAFDVRFLADYRFYFNRRWRLPTEYADQNQIIQNIKMNFLRFGYKISLSLSVLSFFVFLPVCFFYSQSVTRIAWNSAYNISRLQDEKRT